MPAPKTHTDSHVHPHTCHAHAPQITHTKHTTHTTTPPTPDTSTQHLHAHSGRRQITDYKTDFGLLFKTDYGSAAFVRADSQSDGKVWDSGVLQSVIRVRVIAQDWPELKSKMHPTILVCIWLGAFIKTTTLETEHAKMRATVLQAYTVLQGLMRAADRHFSPRQADRFLKAGKILLTAYAWLTREAELSSRPRWPLKPKHHHFDHGVRDAHASRTNPASQWLFRHEDYVGRIAKIAGKAHPAKAAQVCMQRWLTRWAMKGPLRVRGRNARMKRFARKARKVD